MRVNLAYTWPLRERLNQNLWQLKQCSDGNNDNCTISVLFADLLQQPIRNPLHLPKGVKIIQNTRPESDSTQAIAVLIKGWAWVNW